MSINIRLDSDTGQRTLTIGAHERNRLQQAQAILAVLGGSWQPLATSCKNAADGIQAILDFVDGGEPEAQAVMDHEEPVKDEQTTLKPF